ncbi:hypothetical protein C8Q78DRAFT_1012934 [Trametes maxima]|nr:hypothetical protein C8Q78DRAFT_1012934 [Trametes maxima]
MQTHVQRHGNLAAQLDAKLELLEQLGYHGDFFDHDEHHVPPLSEKTAYIDRDTARWVQTEYTWALEEAADSALGIPDLFDVEEEDEDSCLPNIYDPTFFPRPPAPSTPRTRSQSLTQPLTGFDKVSVVCPLVFSCLASLLASIHPRAPHTEPDVNLASDLSMCLAQCPRLSASPLACSGCTASRALAQGKSSDALRLLAFDAVALFPTLARCCGGKVRGSEFSRSVRSPLAWLRRMPRIWCCPD